MKTNLFALLIVPTVCFLIGGALSNGLYAPFATQSAPFAFNGAPFAFNDAPFATNGAPFAFSS
jgi:hypothetical protein